jgi:phage head maturation protease
MCYNRQNILEPAMSDKEIRTGTPLEIRADDGGEIRVSGYAAVFGEETNIGGMFTEVIQRGAFTNAIGRDDVVFLINHEGLPLARTRSGTLTLTEDERGPVYGCHARPDRPRRAQHRSKDEARRSGQNVICVSACASKMG